VPPPPTATSTPNVDEVVCDEPIRFDRGLFRTYGRKGKGGFDVAGTELSMSGDHALAYPLGVQLQSTTVLEVEVASTQCGHNINVGVDTDLNATAQSNIFVCGSRFWGMSSMRLDYPRPGVMGDAVVYRVPIGRYFQGRYPWLTFVNNHDVRNPTANSTFSVRMCRQRLDFALEPVRCSMQTSCVGRKCTVRIANPSSGGPGGIDRMDLVDLFVSTAGETTPLEVAATLKSQNSVENVYTFNNPLRARPGRPITVSASLSGPCTSAATEVKAPTKNQARRRRRR
jgi:hypothetical protein